MPARILTRDADTWRTYAFWFLLISVVFFTVYPFCNWVTANREVTLQLYFRQELAIPLVPEFIWIYLSLYLLFLIPPFFLKPGQMNVLGRQLIASTFFCGTIFLLMPAELGFERTVPADPFYSAIFANMFALDLPHNLVPSLHVAFSALILITLFAYVQTLIFKGIFAIWLVLICSSTVLVHQHHLIYVISGMGVAIALYRLIGRGEKNV
jgi:membrane-associated phospholipid phosphatase